MHSSLFVSLLIVIAMVQTGYSLPITQPVRLTDADDSSRDFLHGEIIASEDEFSEDSGFTKWTPWTSCSVTCGDGFREHTRRCISKDPLKYCIGANVEVNACEGRLCIEGEDFAVENVFKTN